MVGPLFLRHPEPGDPDWADYVDELLEGSDEPKRSAREWVAGPPGDDRTSAPGWQWQEQEGAEND
jgi:hypothetical protein